MADSCVVRAFHHAKHWGVSLCLIRFWPQFGLLQGRPCHSSGCLSPASHHDGLGSIPGQVMWDLWWTKWHWGSFSRVLTFPPANSHSIDCTTFVVMYHPGWYNRLISGRRTKWSQSHRTRRNKRKKKLGRGKYGLNPTRTSKWLTFVHFFR
jgi:hypothetical protein